MKFRNYVINSLIITALVPFMAWTHFQWQDINNTLLNEDRDQRLFTGIGAAFINERLNSIKVFVDYIESKLLPEILSGKSPEDINTLLDELSKAQPYLLTLKLVHQNTTTFTDSDFQWELQDATQSRNLIFKKKLNFISNQLLIGTVSREKLFKDIASMFNMRGVQFILLDEERNFIWTTFGINKDNAWIHSLKKEGEVKEGNAYFWVTANRFSSEGAAWTMLALKPQAERIAQRNLLLLRTGILAALVIILTFLAGFLALRPLINSLKRLRHDLDDKEYASEEATIKVGPSEFIEIQTAYRTLRARLDDKHRTLTSQNIRLEKTVDERSRELSNQEQLFSKVFNDIQEGMLLLNADWDILHINPSAQAILGSSSIKQLISECHKQYLENKVETIRYELFDSDQSSMFECTILPIGSTISTGKKGYCILLSDITGRVTIERMKNDLISIVAHELRTPVTACRLQLDLMRKENKNLIGLGELSTDLDHLSHIIDDWMMVAKIDGGVYCVEPRIVQLIPQINKAVRLVRSRYTFNISIFIDEEAECLFVDPNAFLELLVNLFTNACRYSVKGETPKIEFTAMRNKDYVIEVADYGIGFPIDKSEKIFDRYFQLDPKNKQRVGGTGLGLVICKAICEAHGGSISAKRIDNKTIFEIRLPEAPKQA